jgi:hypothetical protein
VKGCVFELWAAEREQPEIQGAVQPEIQGAVPPHGRGRKHRRAFLVGLFREHKAEIVNRYGMGQ